MELKTKGAGGGGAGREMMDSNTSLPAILTPKHFLAVSAICFDRSDFACTCFSGKVLVPTQLWLSDLISIDYGFLTSVTPSECQVTFSIRRARLIP